MLSLSTSGSFDRTEAWLKRVSQGDIYSRLSKFGEMGVNALSSATPTDTGKTAQSWTYEIVKNGRYWGITWHNTNVVDGRPIAILLQYGHGTGTGGYVQGRDYINPAILPIFDKMADEGWKEVTRG